ncbi:hypothetical protein IQ16_00697 [Bradyrhizobium huanghuaihaiense]|uniref:Uncharacterized protein n=1 Tax=Bradyrhizobium huanghuaihaiense TaxID=990078 RepID=A0A562S7M0_9BRAD|nr:hypothetical protein [Bradyrhizobium huanghuaihaiense]TWI76456.1 hypothetical protein IQ16_00697 [Bradyrhizobium huanghuaihaiense]
MTKTQTYTLYLPEDYIDKDDTVIARGLSATEAMKVVFGYESGWKTNVHESDYGTFTHYVLTAFPDKRRADRAFNERLHATVVRGGDADRDRAAAMEMIAAQVIRFNHLYWEGRVDGDTSFDERLGRVARAREVRRIDREIATKLVDALLADGYTITCDLQDDEPEFEHSTDRDGILDYLWQVECAELAVHKGKKNGSISLTFDEDGWDVVRDYSVDLERIIDPICEPYLPWNQPDADQRDHGIRVLVLNSPDDVLKIEKMLK